MKSGKSHLAVFDKKAVNLVWVLRCDPRTSSWRKVLEKGGNKKRM